ncbi:MAG TPA: DUF2269 family protein [Acidimicrobiia bacterium]|nr:DUF2269 family protein [Acidimicrobiia bacterium]
MVVAAFRGDFTYDILLWAHILCAIIGFGAVVLNGVYGAKAKALAQGGKPGQAAAVAETNYAVSKIGEYFIYAVFVLGILLIVVSDGIWEFSDAWLGAAMGLYIVGLSVAHAVLQPSARRMAAILRELDSAGPPAGGPPPQAAEMAQLGQRLGMFGAINDVILVVILYLMVFKPGA